MNKTENKPLTEREIKLRISEQIENISKTIFKGKDIEITKTSAGIAIKEVSKKKLQ